MKPKQVVLELMEMRRKVVRELPHVGCQVVEVVHGMESGKCSCYKADLIHALLDAEGSVRDAAGMEPF